MGCVVDSFDRANNALTLGNADSGETWTARPSLPYTKAGAPRAQSTSVMGISSNSAYAPGPDYGPVMTIDHGWSDGTVTAQVGWPGSGGAGSGDYGSGLGVVFRWASATSFFVCFLYTDTSGNAGQVYLRKFTGPTTYTDLFSPAAFIPGKVRGDGGDLGVTLDGDLITVTFRPFGSTDPPDVVGTAVDATNLLSTEHGIVNHFSVGGGIGSYGPACSRGGWLVGQIGFG